MTTLIAFLVLLAWVAIALALWDIRRIIKANRAINKATSTN
jgi:hypothetical protein